MNASAMDFSPANLKTEILQKLLQSSSMQDLKASFAKLSNDPQESFPGAGFSSETFTAFRKDSGNFPHLKILMGFYLECREDNRITSWTLSNLFQVSSFNKIMSRNPYLAKISHNLGEDCDLGIFWLWDFYSRGKSIMAPILEQHRALAEQRVLTRRYLGVGKKTRTGKAGCPKML